MSKAKLSVDELKQVASGYAGATLVIDGKNLAHRSAHAVKDDASIAFNRAVQSLCFMINTFNPARVVIAWDDTTENLWRTAIYSAYKERRKSDEVHKAIIHKIQDILIHTAEHFGIHSLWVSTQEADDLIAAICNCSTNNVVIASNDGDLRQLLTIDGVVIYDPLNRRIIDQEYVGRFALENHVKLRALEGDSSDNIIGYMGIGPVNAAKIIRENTLDSFLESVGREKYDLNVQLIDLMNSPYINGNIDIVQNELNRELKFDIASAVKIAIAKRAGSYINWTRDLSQAMRRVRQWRLE